MTASTQTYDFLEPAEHPDDLGMLGHYRVVSELGRGGMGYVFRAQDSKLERVVALKVMNQKIAAIPNSRKRFLSEARSMAAVRHDNVATIFEVNESNGTPFMAMEMLRGGTLEAFNQTGKRLGFEKIIEYASQIARGLSAAHSCGIVHRDIKPANIWIEEGIDRIKILDFGLALASTPVDHLAGRGAVIGTPGYLAPEQARSDPLDDRSDIYSLGVVLYELCTGQLPIQSKSVPGQLISILAHKPTPVNQLNPDIPQPLCDMVHRCLRKEPRARPSSAAVLAEELVQVEHECQQKTEVAQAINRLKLGLDEVVTKKSTDSIFEVAEEAPEVILDPLASLPPTAAAAPMAYGMPTPQARAVSSRPSSPQTKPAESPEWKKYWPIAAAAAAVLIIVPAIVLALSGGSDEPRVTAVNHTPSVNPPPVSSPPTASVNPNANQGGGANKNNQGGAGNKNNQSGNGGKKKWQNNQNNKGAQGNKGGQSVNTGNKNATGDKNRQPANSSMRPVPTPTPVPQPKPTVSSTPPEPPESSVGSEVAAVPTQKMTISVADGRGADGMVQKGLSEKEGLKPSIGIRTRNGVDTNHSYLRFDLAKIEGFQSHIKSSELVLQVLGGSRPVGGTVRVYGFPIGLWPEEQLEWSRSPSEVGISSLELLAEYEIDGGTKENDRQLRIKSDQLAKFVADSAEDTVTIAIAGGFNHQMIRFVSREKNQETAAKLILEVPKDRPVEDEKKGPKRGNKKR